MPFALFTDASVRGSRTAWAYVGVKYKPDEFCGYSHQENLGTPILAGRGIVDGTNNVGELTAVLKALKRLHKHRHSPHLPPPFTVATLVSDSKYVLGGLTDWRHKWEQAEYTKIKNRELWLKTHEVWDDCIIRMTLLTQHVRGHKGVFWNEFVDKWSRELLCPTLLPSPCGQLISHLSRRE